MIFKSLGFVSFRANQPKFGANSDIPDVHWHHLLLFLSYALVSWWSNGQGHRFILSVHHLQEARGRPSHRTRHSSCHFPGRTYREEILPQEMAESIRRFWPGHSGCEFSRQGCRPAIYIDFSVYTDFSDFFIVKMQKYWYHTSKYMIFRYFTELLFCIKKTKS